MLKKASRYSLQCNLEAENAVTLFITLTYSNEHVPLAFPLRVSECQYELYDKETGDLLGIHVFSPSRQVASFEAILSKFNLNGFIPYLKKSDLQKYLKRIRYHVFKKFAFKMRFYSCGEYGPKHFRPHYHILSFLPGRARPHLAELEQIISSCWPYGRISVEVSRGQCAQYTSGYVNSYCLVPEVLKESAFSPFSTHSQFLGKSFLESQRKKAYSSSPREFVRRGFVSNGRLTEFRLWRSYLNVFFPRCKGYATKSSSEREYSYRLYGIARKLFPKIEKPLQLAHEVARILTSYTTIQKVIEINLHNAHYKIKEAFNTNIHPWKPSFLST